VGVVSALVYEKGVGDRECWKLFFPELKILAAFSFSPQEFFPFPEVSPSPEQVSHALRVPSVCAPLFLVAAAQAFPGGAFLRLPLPPDPLPHAVGAAFPPALFAQLPYESFVSAPGLPDAFAQLPVASFQPLPAVAAAFSVFQPLFVVFRFQV